MKTVLIIISVVVWIGISILKAKKKQQAAKNTPRPTGSAAAPGQRTQASSAQKPSYSIESLLEGLVGEVKTPQAQTIRTQAESETTPVFNSSDEGKSHYNNMLDKQELEAVLKEGTSDIQNHKHKYSNAFEEEEETDSFIDSEFDLRQAVLFSEILNNPYLEKHY